MRRAPHRHRLLRCSRLSGEPRRPYRASRPSVLAFLAPLLLVGGVIGCAESTAPPPRAQLTGTLVYDLASMTAALRVQAVHAVELACTGALTWQGTGTDTLRLTVSAPVPVAQDSVPVRSHCWAVGRGVGDTATLEVDATVPGNQPPVITAIVSDSSSYVEPSVARVTWQATGGGPGVERTTCTASSLGDTLPVTDGDAARQTTVPVRGDSQMVVLQCDDGRGLANSVVQDTLALRSYQRLRHQGAVTRLAAVGLEVYDVYAFAAMTHAEVEAAVAAMGDGWTLAGYPDLERIFASTTAAEYDTTLRHMLGARPITVGNTTYHNSMGRINTIDAAYPDFRTLAGFGTGVQIYNHDLERVEYHWSTFGISHSSYLESRYASHGAWVVRPFVR